MNKEKRMLCVLIVLFLLLEIPLVVFWRQYRQAEELLSPDQSAEAAPQLTQTTDPVETAVIETTLPMQTEPPETSPSETEPPATLPPRITVDSVPQYFQNDYPEEPYGTGTVASSGSSMTALAMVATYLTDHEVYPDQMADQLAHFLGGNYQRLEYGNDLLQLSWYRAANIHESLQAVRDGKIVILMLNANNYFTWKEHYVVLTGVTESGKYAVMDTDSSHLEKGWLQTGYAEGFSESELVRAYSCGWVYDKSAMPEEPFVYTPEAAPEESRYHGLELTQYDKELLAKLLCMEAGSEPFEGQQAVAEVVLNRLYSGRFQSTVYNVIHAEGQFPSASRLYKGDPDYSQYKAIEQALNGPYVLPEDVYFFAKFKMNDNVWGQIGSHYFCYSY